MKKTEKGYFSSMSKKVAEKVIDQAAHIAEKVLDKKKSQAKRLCWAAAMYAAVEAAETAAPALMTAGRQLYNEMKEAYENVSN